MVEDAATDGEQVRSTVRLDGPLVEVQAVYVHAVHAAEKALVQRRQSLKVRRPMTRGGSRSK
jgi:hypothetical protein